MPTYDYACVQCAHVFETVHKMTESPKIPCPACGGLTEKKISAGARMVFKGSGWYVTDYANNNGGSEDNSSEGGSDDHSCGSTCAMHQKFDIPGDDE